MKILEKLSLQYKYFIGLITFIAILYLRSPELLKYGRYFAEEGSIFWSYSLRHGYLDTLLFVDIMTGYFSFNTNIQILFTKFLNINLGPLFTTWSSLFIGLMPSLFFFKLNENILEEKVLLLQSFILLTLPSLNFLEVFANSINSKTYLGVTTFIILNYGIKNKKYLKIQNLVIFIGFLSSYYSLILLPAFLIKGLYEKNKNIIPILTSGIIASFVHINILFFSLSNNLLYEDKFQNKGSLTYIFEVFNGSVLINLVGEKYFKNEFLSKFSILAMLIIIYFVIYKKIPFKEYYLIIISFFLELILLYFGQIGLEFNQRYAVVISTIFMFLIFHIFNYVKNNLRYITLYFLITLVLFTHQQSLYFIECTEFCYYWPDQIEDAQMGLINDYVHWPLGEGEPYWSTSIEYPKVNPSPFQIEILKQEYFLFSEITLINIIKANLTTLFS